MYFSKNYYIPQESRNFTRMFTERSFVREFKDEIVNIVDISRDWIILHHKERKVGTSCEILTADEAESYKFLDKNKRRENK